MTYGPKGMKRKSYQAKIEPDGGLSVLGNTFSSPSYAALSCIKDAGSDRDTVNGWTSWKTKKGELLAQIREKYLTSSKDNSKKFDRLHPASRKTER